MSVTVSQSSAVPVAAGVHWIGAFDPGLRSFDIILRTTNGTSYNAYAVRGSTGVAVIDTVKAEFADSFFARLESVADYAEITTIVQNHLEPDHSGALPELLRRAPQAQLYVSHQARPMLKGRFDPAEFAGRITGVGTGDTVSLGNRELEFLNTPYLHWPDTQCTWLASEGMLFSGDFLGCHYCDERLFNDAVGDFRFSFDYYYAHIMRPFRGHVRNALDLIEEADALIFGSPTINGDAVKPLWDLLSSLTMVDVKGKLGAAFGSYGWSGEAVPMIEDRLRRLKLRVPVPGVKARLLPTADEFAACHELGRQAALHLLGRAEHRAIDMAALA